MRSSLMTMPHSLSVSLSLSLAVRFGRIPKREKQRMLLEMQSAMNNMMTNGDLHANQQLAIAAVAPPAHPADPVEPDPEPAVAMDTGPSSASDSGEEEVIGSVTRAHREDFMYNQEQGRGLSSGGTPPSPSDHQDGGVGVADGNKVPSYRPSGTEERQEAWTNLHNNLSTVAAQGPPAAGGSDPPGPEALSPGDRCPYRLPYTSPGGQCPANPHGSFKGPHHHAVGGGNRMHLVRAAESPVLFSHFRAALLTLTFCPSAPGVSHEPVPPR